MATWYTDIATNQQAGLNFPGGGLTTQPGQYNDSALELANADYIIANYTMTGTEAASDTINIAWLQAGVSVVPLGYLFGNGIATTATVSVGDADPAGVLATRYSAALNVAANGAQVIMSGGAQGLTATPYYFVSTDCWLTATFATLTTPVAGKILRFIIPIAAPR